MRSISNKNQNIFFTASRSFPLIMRNVSVKTCRENQDTHFVLSNIFENRAVYQIMSEKHCRAQQVKNDNIALAQNTLDT